jgi:apolipoprotein N-acyltransferase
MDTLKVGICQPYLLDKWEEGRASMHKDILRRQTKFLSLLKPDLIIWPEASSPYPLNLDRLWAEELSKETQTPILAGSVIREKDTSYNAMVYLDPQSGMDSRWYAKQVLVPFGEYVPNPFAYIPGFRKLVGPVGNFLAGEHPHIFEFPLGGGDSRVNLRIGNLICYEDIFPYISRTTSEEDVDLLVVSTNDAWFKEEGCAEQHAAHSVLRAVENGIPIVRCGNAGWSGWIDRMGIQREVLRNKEGSVYFQGAKVLEVKVPRRSDNDEFRVGDHFAHICGFLSLAIGLHVYFTHKKAAFNP